jgi:hypothetical protein
MQKGESANMPDNVYAKVPEFILREVIEKPTVLEEK